MLYALGFDYNQLLCCLWNAFIDKESISRIMDAFVDYLDMGKYNEKSVTPEKHLKVVIRFLISVC